MPNWLLALGAFGALLLTAKFLRATPTSGYIMHWTRMQPPSGGQDIQLKQGSIYRWSMPQSGSLTISLDLITRLSNDFLNLHVWDRIPPIDWPQEDLQADRDRFEGIAKIDGISFKPDIPIWIGSQIAS